MKILRSVTGLGIVGMVTVAGCAAETEATADATGAVVPTQATSDFEQVKTCDNLFKDRAAFRDVDLQEGVLRWKCGDVDGVTASRCEDDLDAIARRESQIDVDVARDSSLRECADGFGQEYCEYNAVAKGRVVNSVNAGRSVRDSDVVECVFTAVHADVKGTESPAFHKELASKLQPQLTAAEGALEGRVAGMKQGVNSREAADMLISDCATLGSADDAGLHKNAERQVRCYRAWTAARTPASKAKIAAKCAGVDLGDDAAWAATGIADATLSEADKDLAACTMILRAANGGISWRNSDPTICARSYRAARECGVGFEMIGQAAPDFPGFSMMGWTNRNTLPPGCKYAVIDGAAYKQLVICTPSKTDVKAYRTQRKPLQQLCRDKFGLNVAMQAPIGALAKLDNARTETPFCQAFVAGARAAQGGRSAASQ